MSNKATLTGLISIGFLATAAAWILLSPSTPSAPPSAPKPGNDIPAVQPPAPPATTPKTLTIDYPQNKTLFPPNFPTPTFLFHDASAADTWRVEASFAEGKPLCVVTRADLPIPAPKTPLAQRHPSAKAYTPAAELLSAKRWKPDAKLWSALQNRSTAKPARITIVGYRRDEPDCVLSRGLVTLATSTDPVDAPIFFRDVPLPFIHAFENPKSIRWRLGEVTSNQPPKTLLTDMKVCGNCHSFTADGKTLAMDVDYGNDKGSYVIAEIKPTTVLSQKDVISWSNYKRDEGDLTFGLLSQISPDGRHVISTVKDRSVFLPTEDLHYSQRFFPIKGILAVYDRQAKTFASLPGGNDPAWVQSNPNWSPDGKTILFSRATAHELKALKEHDKVLLQREEAKEFFEGGRTLRFDICRVGFNRGQGGKAELIPGASANNKSNYFPRFSPDGKWIVFCQANSFMLLRPDSTLYIMPATGGKSRKMRCNLDGKMNSWHSFSPNGRWLVFSSKARGPYTQLWLTHIDPDGNDTPAVLLEHFTDADRAANIPEFVNVKPEQFASIRQEFADYYTHYSLARQHATRQKIPQAIEEARKAIAEKSDHADSLYLLASCLARTGREPAAVPYAKRAIAADAAHWRSRRLLGGIYSRDGHYTLARTLLLGVLKEQPNDPMTLNNLTWMLATCPAATIRNGTQAVVYGKRACDATKHTVPPMLDSLAAAYAEAGQFDLAIQTLQTAIGLYRQRNLAPPREFQTRLGIFQQRRAWREGPAPK